MNVLQHTRNELNLCLKQNRPDRSYRDTLLNVKSGEVLSTMDVNDFVTCLAACPLNRVLAVGLDHSTPNFKVIRVHLPRGEDSKNGKR